MTIVARDIMTPNVKSVPQEWTVQRFATFLSENQISGSPVVDEDGEIVGIATLFDIADFHFNQSDGRTEAELTEEEQREARALKQLLFEEMARTPVEVRDIMTTKLVSVREDAGVGGIARLMMEEHIHRVFVTQGKTVVGIITTYDMLRLLSDQYPPC